MGSLKFFSVSVVALLATTAFTNAADIIDPPYVEVIPEVTHIESVGGWYLRGDVGYAHMSVSHVDKIIATDVIAPGYFNWSSAELDQSFSYGGGIGYQINGTLRVDATLRHFGETDFTGDSSTVGGSFACSALSVDDATADTCTVSDTTTFAATALMANAYADLGTFSGFTPYVGAGIGGAYTHWGTLKNDIDCEGAGACIDGGGASYNTDFDGDHSGKNGWRFAYAAHAGASFDLTSSLKLDAGYSFTHISGGDMYGFQSSSGVMGHHGDIKIHEVKAGLRYSFN